jgi:hypothetical protein
MQHARPTPDRRPVEHSGDHGKGVYMLETGLWRVSGMTKLLAAGRWRCLLHGAALRLP